VKTPVDVRKHAGTVSAVVFDFYGTLARATRWLSIDVLLAEHGYELPTAVHDRWWNDGIDGIEHLEPSQSREAYEAWQHDRLLGMLAETDVHPGEYEEILEQLRRGNETRLLEAYPEVPGVLERLQGRNVTLAVCSNWGWDLAEALAEVGLGDEFQVVVSSAWAGARKPHPRIFEHTLGQLGIRAAEAVFVGDTWGPDVVGPAALGMTPLYLRRRDHWADQGAPADPGSEGVRVAADLTPILELVEDAA
jgi:putative hydrolase of the HAD superfamily